MEPQISYFLLLMIISSSSVSCTSIATDNKDVPVVFGDTEDSELQNISDSEEFERLIMQSKLSFIVRLFSVIYASFDH